MKKSSIKYEKFLKDKKSILIKGREINIKLYDEFPQADEFITELSYKSIPLRFDIIDEKITPCVDIHTLFKFFETVIDFDILYAIYVPFDCEIKVKCKDIFFTLNKNDNITLAHFGWYVPDQPIPFFLSRGDNYIYIIPRDIKNINPPTIYMSMIIGVVVDKKKVKR